MVRYRSETGGIDDTVNPKPAGNSPGWPIGTAVVVLAGTAYAIPVVLGRTDWDFVLQKTAVLTLWGGTLACCRSEERRVGKECRSRWAREHRKQQQTRSG